MRKATPWAQLHLCFAGLPSAPFVACVELCDIVRLQCEWWENDKFPHFSVFPSLFFWRDWRRRPYRCVRRPPALWVHWCGPLLRCVSAKFAICRIPLSAPASIAPTPTPTALASRPRLVSASMSSVSQSAIEARPKSYKKYVFLALLLNLRHAATQLPTNTLNSPRLSTQRSSFFF